MFWASAEARNTTAWPMSSGTSSLLMGAVDLGTLTLVQNSLGVIPLYLGWFSTVRVLVSH